MIYNETVMSWYDITLNCVDCSQYLSANSKVCGKKQSISFLSTQSVKGKHKFHSFEFSLNDFLWIQWIMTKSKSGMVIRGITHLATNTLPVPVIQSVFSWLPLGRYLLSLTTLNRYQPTDSSEKFFFTTTSRNVSIVRYRMSLVAILPLDFVMIHWIRWIQRKSFRENSINSVWSHCKWMWLAHFGGQRRENCITLFDSLQLVPRNIILHYRVNSSWHQHLLPIYIFWKHVYVFPRAIVLSN